MEPGAVLPGARVESRALFLLENKNEEKPSCDVELVPVGMHPIRFYPPGEMSSTPLILLVGQYRVEIEERFDPGTLARLVSTLEPEFPSYCNEAGGVTLSLA